MSPTTLLISPSNLSLQKRHWSDDFDLTITDRDVWLMMMLCIETSLSVILRSKSSLQCLYCKRSTQTKDTPACPLTCCPPWHCVSHLLSIFHFPTPFPVLALPCNPYDCQRFCLSLLFSPEEAKLAKRREKKRNYRKEIPRLSNCTDKQQC